MKKILFALLFWSIALQAQKKCGFIDGLQEGNCIFFYENGQKKWDQNWKKGKLDGNYIAYFENGKEKAKGVYKKDRKVGEWVYYDQSGSKTGTETYNGWKGDVYIVTNLKILILKMRKLSVTENLSTEKKKANGNTSTKVENYSMNLIS
ncbi:antitoxin component YwqK of YwqJK toxin-antitoxin module [Chryseobacterium ginsenosidimutans]|nr:hypothetical protein [Chryseobacterium ginsenosidimutans]MDQ0592312.1 antitoxin component YwqK of YwqJK toxin-antitoxin module [Chryseobacterium ginsenosidimutans]